jgi:uncharacterized protein
MRIGVISDTHGSKASIQRAVLAAGPVDMWLHAGDYSQDAGYLSQLTGRPVTAVAGNCDGLTDVRVDEFIAVENKTIWLTHGHRYRAKERSAELIVWARQYNADIVVYGHSHVADISWEGDLLLFNPGSTAHPRGGEASCGLLLVEAGRVEAEIVRLS